MASDTLHISPRRLSIMELKERILKAQKEMLRSVAFIIGLNMESQGEVFCWIIGDMRSKRG